MRVFGSLTRSASLEPRLSTCLSWSVWLFTRADAFVAVVGANIGFVIFSLFPEGVQNPSQGNWHPPLHTHNVGKGKWGFPAGSIWKMWPKHWRQPLQNFSNSGWIISVPGPSPWKERKTFREQGGKSVQEPLPPPALKPKITGQKFLSRYCTVTGCPTPSKHFQNLAEKIRFCVRNVCCDIPFSDEKFQNLARFLLPQQSECGRTCPA